MAPDPVQLEAVLHEVLLKRRSPELIPGVSVAVAHHGQIVADGVGRVDLRRTATVTADTMFAAGSVTKVFTATLLLMLAERGLLDLDDLLCKQLPELTTADDRSLR